MPPAFCFPPDGVGSVGVPELVFGSVLIYQRSMATQTMSQSSVSGAKVISSAKPSLWILDRWRDLLLFVGTPVLLIPLFTAAQARWSAQVIFLFVGAFGAMGHRLPGMIRACADPALLDRFKIRFVVAPVALLAVCIWSSVYDIQALQLVAFGW